MAEPSDHVIRGLYSAPNPNTARVYGGSMRRFAAFNGAATPVEALRAFLLLPFAEAETVALNWRNSMAQLLAPKSVNTTLAALRYAVVNAKRLGIVGWMLATKRVPELNYTDVPFALRPDKYQEMLKQIRGEMDAQNPAVARDLAIVRLIFELAFRRGELAGLNLADVDLAQGTILVPPWGHRDRRAVQVPADLLEAIAEWVNLRGTEPGPLWMSLDAMARESDRRLTKRAVYDIVRGWAEKSGTSGMNCRRARHGGVLLAAKVAANGNAAAVALHARLSHVRTVQMFYGGEERAAAGDVARRVTEAMMASPPVSTEIVAEDPN